MAWTEVGTAVGVNAASSSGIGSLTKSVTGGNLLLVPVLTHGSPTINSDSLNGTSNWVLLTPHNNITSSSKYYAIFYNLSTAGGSCTFEWNDTSGQSHYGIIREYNPGAGMKANYDTNVFVNGVNSGTAMSLNGGAPLHGAGDLIFVQYGLNTEGTDTFTASTNIAGVFSAAPSGTSPAALVTGHDLNSGAAGAAYAITQSVSGNWGGNIIGFFATALPATPPPLYVPGQAVRRAASW